MIQDEFRKKLDDKDRELKELEARVAKYQEISMSKQLSYENQLAEVKSHDSVSFYSELEK